MPINPQAKRQGGVIAKGWAGSFGCGLLAGCGSPFMRQVFFGQADPFIEAWPLFLQAGSFLAALLIGYIFRRPFVAAAGVYLGLEAYLFAFAAPEYPASASTALAVHGLLPALLGASASLALRSVARMRRAESPHT